MGEQAGNENPPTNTATALWPGIILEKSFSPEAVTAGKLGNIEYGVSHKGWGKQRGNLKEQEGWWALGEEENSRPNLGQWGRGAVGLIWMVGGSGDPDFRQAGTGRPDGILPSLIFPQPMSPTLTLKEGELCRNRDSLVPSHTPAHQT